MNDRRFRWTITNFEIITRSKIIDNLKRKIPDENKNLLLCIYLIFCASLIKRSRNVVKRRNCHHFLLFSCVIIIKNRTPRQIIFSVSSSTKIELKNLFSWMSLSSCLFFDDNQKSSKACRIFFFKQVISALHVIETL